jgi:hypothetical protein
MNFYKRQKRAHRGNMPLIEEYNPKQDPYRKKQPGDTSSAKLVNMGDEEDGSSVMGTRVRGELFPEVPGMKDYDKQRSNDIPTSTHTLMGEEGESVFGEGANDDRFVDWRDKIADDIGINDPKGIFDMNNSKGQEPKPSDIIDRMQKRIQGV